MPTPASLQTTEIFVYPHHVRRTHPARSSARPSPPASHEKPKISATILTKNSSAHLAQVLAALAWCDEILVFDTGSSDDTLAIARRHRRVTIHQLSGPFPGFGRAHQQAVALARNDWILSIDSDEIVSPKLAAEIAELPLEPNAVYSIPFHNFFNGRLITSCGWFPDRHERLFNRTVTDFCASEVHERVQTDHLAVRRLQHPIEHYSYGCADDFLRKMRAYSQLFADQSAGRKSAGPLKAVTRSAWAFAKSYFVQRGLFQGYEGLVISVYKAQTVFWKYIYLHEANRRPA